ESLAPGSGFRELTKDVSWGETIPLSLRVVLAIAALALSFGALQHVWVLRFKAVAQAQPASQRIRSWSRWLLRLGWCIFLFLVSAGLLYFRANAWAHTPDAAGVFSYWRAIHLSNWLSPILPTVALCLALLMMGSNVLRLIGIDSWFSSNVDHLHINIRT